MDTVEVMSAAFSDELQKIATAKQAAMKIRKRDAAVGLAAAAGALKGRQVIGDYQTGKSFRRQQGGGY